MITFTLSDEELFGMSALCGVENMWSLPDPLRDRSDAEIPYELLRLQEQLLRKGLLRLLPNGRCVPDAALMGMLEHCKACERVYVFNSQRQEDEGVRLRFFEHSGIFIRYCFRGEAELSQVNRELAFQEVHALFGGLEAPEGPDFSVETGVTRLRHMGSLSREHFLLELKNSGCDETSAGQIAEALQGKSEFCSLLVYDREDGAERLGGKLVALRAPGSAVMARSGSGRKESVRLSRLTAEKLDQALETLFGVETEVAAV